MSKAKQKIPLEKLASLVQMLHVVSDVVQGVINECEGAERDFVMTDGWRSMGKGLQHILDQTAKIVGPASRIHSLDSNKIMIEGETVPPTRRTSSKEKQKESAKQSRKGIKIKVKRNDDSK